MTSSHDAGALATRRSEVSTGARSPGPAQDRILEATERLLAEVPFHDLSVARILEAAGITRPTFYSYFGSKAEVVSALFIRAAGEVREAVRPLWDRPAAQGPAQAITLAVTRTARVWHAHRAVLGAAVENRHAIPEIQRATAEMLVAFVDGISRQLEADRAGGQAPPGPPSAPLVSMLVRSTDQTFYTAGCGTDPNLPDEQAVIPLLVTLWLRTLYGWAPTMPGQN